VKGSNWCGLLIENVHITGPHIQIQRRIPLDPPDPGQPSQTALLR
jgi:hypothetical protein